MNWFLKHIPNCVDVEKRPQRIPFATTADLLEIDDVKDAAAWKGFSHFALHGDHLMAICSPEWWVIGLLGDAEAVDLPKWEAPGAVDAARWLAP